MIKRQFHFKRHASVFRRQVRGAAVAVTLAAFLTACSGNANSSTADYIGIDAAKEAALKDAGVAPEEADFSTAGLDNKDGTFYYQIAFTANGEEQEYAIDAVTGVVIEKTDASSVSAQGTNEDGGNPESQGDGTSSQTAQSPENGETSEIPADSQSVQESSPAASQGSIDPLAIALSHAGLEETDISYSKVKEDLDDGLHIYEVEFFSSDGVEYDYEILADDGTIIKFDQETKSPVPPSGSGSGIVAEEEARQSVVKRVPGASAQDISLILREDDGRMEYKGRLLYDNMAYEFQIDAYSGNIVEWEAENINFSS